MCHHNPLHCAIPPYMLEKLAAKGKTAAAREAALAALKISRHFRVRRREAQATFQSMGFGAVHLGALAAPTKLVRKVYDAENSESLPGKLVRSEGDPKSKDKTVNEVYDGAGETDMLFREEYGRNSIDDRGMEIIQTVHFGKKYQNAFWNGDQMVYGDGDGQVFGSFSSDLDIIGHELTHGVTQYEAGLAYQFQSGALNEHFSDVFGTLVKQRANGKQTVTQADWLIGENVLIGKKYALRSMKAPGTAYVNHPVLGTDPQPATMDDYQDLPIWEDNGGVHINSGIPNQAFYLAAMTIGGYAWAKTGLIWYRALCDLLSSNATFVRAAQATIQTARSEFGVGSLEEQAVTKAWKDVKVI